MRYELAIFDFDDTILHLDVDWPSVGKEMLSLAAESQVDIEPDLHLAVMANDLSKAGLKKEIDRIFLRYEGICVQSRSYKAFPRMISLVKELKSNGVKLAIASGNHTQSIKKILSQLGLSGSFDMVCGRDLVARNKPDPDQLVLITGKLGIGKDRTVFTGDSKNDEAAARAAGIRYVKVDPADMSDGIKALRELLL